MWMLARKHIEQWLTWILVDIVSCGLYIYQEISFTSALYGIYAIVAIFGYMKWNELMASGQCSLNKAQQSRRPNTRRLRINDTENGRNNRTSRLLQRYRQRVRRP